MVFMNAEERGKDRNLAENFKEEQKAAGLSS